MRGSLKEDTLAAPASHARGRFFLLGLTYDGAVKRAMSQAGALIRLRPPLTGSKRRPRCVARRGRSSGEVYRNGPAGARLCGRDGRRGRRLRDRAGMLVPVVSRLTHLGDVDVDSD